MESVQRNNMSNNRERVWKQEILWIQRRMKLYTFPSRWETINREEEIEDRREITREEMEEVI